MKSKTTLEGLMLMKVENEIAMNMDSTVIIDKIADHSASYGKLLKL